MAHYKSSPDIDFDVHNEVGLGLWLKDAIMAGIRHPTTPSLEIKTLRKPVVGAIPLSSIPERLQTAVATRSDATERVKQKKAELADRIKPYEAVRKRYEPEAVKYLRSQHNSLNSRLFHNPRDSSRNMVMYLDPSRTTKALSVKHIQACIDEVVGNFLNLYFPELLGRPFNITTVPAVRSRWPKLCQMLQDRIQAIHDNEELVTTNLKFKAKILPESDHLWTKLLQGTNKHGQLSGEGACHSGTEGSRKRRASPTEETGEEGARSAPKAARQRR